MCLYRVFLLLLLLVNKFNKDIFLLVDVAPILMEITRNTFTPLPSSFSHQTQSHFWLSSNPAQLLIPEATI